VKVADKVVTIGDVGGGFCKAELYPLLAAAHRQKSAC